VVGGGVEETRRRWLGAARRILGGGGGEWRRRGGGRRDSEGDGEFSFFLRGKKKRGQPLEIVDFTDLSTYAT
jgi:hypothetical protein